MIAVIAIADLIPENTETYTKSADLLLEDMQSDALKEKVYIIQFYKNKGKSDTATLAATNNQFEGITQKIQSLPEITDDIKKPIIVAVEINKDSEKLRNKWKVKDTEANSRPLWLVSKGGDGKKIQGPLATTKLWALY